MEYKLLNLDLSVITFKGLSRPHQRKIALGLTFLIWIGTASAGIIFVQHIGNNAVANNAAAIFLSFALLDYILGGEFIILSGAKKLLRITPLGILYQQDRYILDRTKSLLISIAEQIKFRDYLVYGKINPAIQSRSSLLVIAHQESGDLRTWVDNFQNLKQLANLVYQIYLIEQRLAEGERKGHVSMTL